MDKLTEPAAQQGVHPTGGSLRVFGQFAWLEVGSVKMALSRPAHQPSSGCYATGNAHRWAAEIMKSILIKKQR
jgi:hypothetical protein